MRTGRICSFGLGSCAGLEVTGRAGLLPERGRGRARSPFLQSQGCCEWPCHQVPLICNLAPLRAQPLRKGFCSLCFGMLHLKQRSSKVELRKPQPQSRLEFNLRKGALHFGAGFQQEFSFPLVHTEFCLIRTEKGMLTQILHYCKSYSSICLILQSQSHSLIGNTFLQGLSLLSR